MPRIIPENERIDYFIENFVNPMLGHLFGLGLALKKNRCYKAFRNYRTILARSGALTNSFWFEKPESVHMVREYLERGLQVDLVCSPKHFAKTTIRSSIRNYARVLAEKLYEFVWRVVEGHYVARYVDYNIIQELDSYFNVHVNLTFLLERN